MKEEDNESSKAKGETVKPDYYMENGFMVFTETFHLRRGYCCKNGCRHCPYGFKKQQTD